MVRARKLSATWAELNSSAEARWLTTVEVFNQQGEAQQLKLFPSHVEPPPDDPGARVLPTKCGWKELGSSAPAFSGWNYGSGSNWIVSSNKPSTASPPMCRGRGWQRCWRSIVSVRRAASWRSNNAGIHPPRWTICCRSKKARSTIRACIGVWTAFCRTRRNWSGI
jgi:hypothetical protein